MSTTRGTFEFLTQQVVAAGFDPKSDLAKRVKLSYEEGGVLVLNAADKAAIEKGMKQHPDSLRKYHAFLSYLMEFGYDLAIAPSSNVSGSFGFEGFVGLCGR